MTDCSSWVLCLKLAMLAGRCSRGCLFEVVLLLLVVELPVKRNMPALIRYVNAGAAAAAGDPLAHDQGSRTMGDKKQRRGASPRTTSMRLARVLER